MWANGTKVVNLHFNFINVSYIFIIFEVDKRICSTQDGEFLFLPEQFHFGGKTPMTCKMHGAFGWVLNFVTPK